MGGGQELLEKLWKYLTGIVFWPDAQWLDPWPGVLHDVLFFSLWWDPDATWEM